MANLKNALKGLKGTADLKIHASIGNEVGLKNQFDKLGKVKIHPTLIQSELDALLEKALKSSTKLSLKIQDVNISKATLQSGIDKNSSTVCLLRLVFNSRLWPGLSILLLPILSAKTLKAVSSISVNGR